MVRPINPLLARLRYHVTGAIERGEAEAIVGIPAALVARVCIDCGCDAPQQGGCPARAGDALPCRMRPDVHDIGARGDHDAV